MKKMTKLILSIVILVLLFIFSPTVVTNHFDDYTAGIIYMVVISFVLFLNYDLLFKRKKKKITSIAFIVLLFIFFPKIVSNNLDNYSAGFLSIVTIAYVLYLNHDSILKTKKKETQ